MSEEHQLTRAPMGKIAISMAEPTTDGETLNSLVERVENLQRVETEAVTEFVKFVSTLPGWYPSTDALRELVVVAAILYEIDLADIYAIGSVRTKMEATVAYYRIAGSLP